MSPELETPVCRLHDQWKKTVDDSVVRSEDEIRMLRERSHKLSNDVAAVSGDILKIETEILHLTERIPLDLGVRLVRFEMKIDEISKQLAADFVKRMEFEVLKVEHEQMKKIIYGFVAIILIAVVGAVVALVVKQ
jgi:hypothetical protein